MRTGGYTLQQSLTAEAATVVKQAVTLARRRGHAQVTPLHVASIMLASSVGLFRRACLQAHSHPLQCKALELCFNVALNRLPTTSTSSPIPILGSHHHHHHHHLQLPSLSNALIAAFKRAQAHQRRGSLENQQQPILALKVEIEQLVISILDDPSVSRVMREAGFSSTQVKSKVEQTLAVSSNSCSSMAAETASASVVIAADASAANIIKPPPLPPFILGNNNYMPQTFKLSLERTRTTSHDQQVREDDVMSIVGAMMNSKKTKNTVIVGECPSTAESVVKGVIEKFDTGNVPGDMKNVQFISVPLFSLRNITREEFEMKLGELRSLVKSYISKGVVLYLGDLRWVSDFWSKYCEQRMNSLRSQYYKVYSPVEHMIMELSRLLCGNNNNTNPNGKLWIMGIATLNTYMKCKTGRPSLETLWDLHPLTIPVGSLALSLNLDSCSELNNQPLGESKSKSWLLQYSCNNLGSVGVGGDDDDQEKYYYKYLNCCADCLANFNKEARGITRINNNDSIHGTSTTPSSSSLPSWLQQYKEEKQKETSQSHDQDFEKIKKDLCTKWNSICKSVHGNNNNVVPKCGSPMSTSSSASVSSSSSTDHHRLLLINNNKLPLIFEKQQQPSNNYDFDYKEPKLFSHNYHHQYYSSKPEIKPELLSNPNSSPNSASSSEASGYDIDIDNDDTDLVGRRLAAEEKEEELICSALEKKVPWQKDIIRDIVRTVVVECRLINKTINNREDTWLCFVGSDFEGKDKIGRELATAIFGNNNNFVTMGIRRRRHVDSVEEEVVIGNNKKRRRVDDDVEERGSNYLERFGGAVRENPSRVFFLEDFDGIVDDNDNHTRKRLKKAMETGILDLSASSSPVLLKDAIVIFNSEKRLAQMRNNYNNNNNDINGGGDDGDDKNRSKITTCLDLNVATEEEEEGNEGGIMELMDKKMIFKINRN